MKDKIINLVNSIEGYGNLIVTKPNGESKKYPFKNTITEHFRANLMNAILYGDRDDSVTDWTAANKSTKGFYYSNKMLAYRFRVKVGTNTNDPTTINSAAVADGTDKKLTYNRASNTLGETRYGLIGYVNADQAKISDLYGSSPIHFAEQYNQDVNLENIDGFEEGQNVFVGNQHIGNGVVVPIFRPARENLRWAELSSGVYGVPTSAQASSLEIRNINIDTPSGLIADWDSYVDAELGVQATVRQSLGPAPWQIAAYKTSDTDLIDKYSKRIYYRNNPDAQTDASLLSRLKQDQVNALWFQSEVGVISRDDFYGDLLDSDDFEHFYPHSWEIGQPQSPYYWSFISDEESWGGGAQYTGRDTDNIVAGITQTGKVLGIEVQNFPVGNTEAETLAFHIPSSNIEIDRNDNITVEYNFKFTKPSTGSNLNWNIAYIDELSRAINPITQDETVGVKSLFTNRAKRIQLTGAAIFEEGIKKATNSVTKKPEWLTVSSTNPTGGDYIALSELDHSDPDAFGNYPAYTKEEIDGGSFAASGYKWRNDDRYAGSSVAHTITRDAWPTTIRKKSPQWGGSINYETEATSGDDITYDPSGSPTSEQEMRFWRIMTSPVSDLYCYKDGNEWKKDFTNVNVIDGDYTDNITKSSATQISDLRSFYNQVKFTPSFERIVAHLQKIEDDGAGYDRNAHAALIGYMWTKVFGTKTTGTNNTTDYDKSVGNMFDYFKNMLSDRHDIIGYRNYSGSQYDFLPSLLSYEFNRCQVWLTPYGSMTHNILEHSKGTDWLGDQDFYRVDGVQLDDETDHPSAMMNVDTIWQNGVRLVDPNNSLSLTPEQAIDKAANLLLPKTESSASSYLVKTTDSGDGQTESKINFKVTTNGHMATPPRFFKAFYGMDGHPVSADFKDTDTDSYWTLKENWREVLINNFNQFRSTGNDLKEVSSTGLVTNKARVSDEEYFKDVYETFADDMYPTSDGAYDLNNPSYTITQAQMSAIETKINNVANKPTVVKLQSPANDDIIGTWSYDAHNNEPKSFENGWANGETYVQTAGYRETRNWEVDDLFDFEQMGSNYNASKVITLTTDAIIDVGLLAGDSFTHNDLLGTRRSDYRGQFPSNANPYYWVAGWAVDDGQDDITDPNIATDADRVVLMSDLDTFANTHSNGGDTQLITHPAKDFIKKWVYSTAPAPFNIEVTAVTDTDVDSEAEANNESVVYWEFGSVAEKYPRGNLSDCTGVYTSYAVADRASGDPHNQSNLVDGSGTIVVDRWGKDGLGRYPRTSAGWATSTNAGTENVDDIYYVKTEYNDLKVPNTNAKVNSTLKGLYRPKITKGGIGKFGIPSKLRMIDGSNNILSGDEEHQALYRWTKSDSTFNPFGTNLQAIISNIENFSGPKDDRTLKQLIQHYAPYGFLELYDFHDGTPAYMSLDFPNPKQDMFYGLIDTPGSTGDAGNVLMTNISVQLNATDDDFDYLDNNGATQTFVHSAILANTSDPDADGNSPPGAKWEAGDYYVVSIYQQSDPTWTKGDKIELTWTINPPVTGGV